LEKRHFPAAISVMSTIKAVPNRIDDYSYEIAA